MTTNTVMKAQYDAPAITKTLAEFVVNHPSKGWTDEVEHEAHRTLINWLGCAIGASHHESTENALHAFMELEPAPQSTIPGRKEKVDMATAAVLMGISSHAYDFDDTHLRTIIHPAGPIASALLPLAQKTKASGRQLIDALVIGIDVFCRIGNMIYPQHYDRGWHITGTAGGIGAAAAASRLLNLDLEKTTMALGIAASQPVGLREQFGTMTKPLHPGAAARVGLTAALLAKHGFTASNRAIEAARGFAQVISDKVDWEEITTGLGDQFEISINTYKPFACGIVIHPSIDACIQLSEKYNLQAEDIESITLQVHSLVLELTGKKEPKDGLEAKFSVYHSAAAGFIYGKAGEDEYADHIVTEPRLIELRRRITATVDPEIKEQEVKATVICKDGTRYQMHIPHAIGSLENPLTDAMLDKKFDSLVIPVLGKDKCELLKKEVKNISNSSSLESFFELCN